MIMNISTVSRSNLYRIHSIFLHHVLICSISVLRSNTSMSSGNKISTSSIERIMNNLRYNQNRSTTNDTYLRIWRQFNKFIILLDRKPSSWEERTSLFLASMVDQGMKSQSVKSYASAIKKILINDDYQWDDNKVLLGALTRSARLVNDSVRTRLPIGGGLLELILYEIQRKFRSTKQIYLECLYKAMFLLGYYGLLRVGELTKTNIDSHTIKAKNVHMATNKDKLLIILYSSKTHSKANIPQKIKICSNKGKNTNYIERNFCPFKEINKYIDLRGKILKTDNEQFFIFRDRSAVTADNARSILKEMLTKLGLNCDLYGMHSLRIGRASDLLLKFNYSISEIKRAGRWRSGAVFRYLRD